MYDVSFYKCLFKILVGFVCAVDVLKPTIVDKLPNDLEGMEASMERLLALIDDIYKYVDDVAVRMLFFCFLLMLYHFAYDFDF